MVPRGSDIEEAFMNAAGCVILYRGLPPSGASFIIQQNYEQTDYMSTLCCEYCKSTVKRDHNCLNCGAPA